MKRILIQRFLEIIISSKYILPLFQSYLYGFPIGLALGIPQEDIAWILEQNNSLDAVAGQLSKRANDLCRTKHPHFGYNENIVRDLITVMLTNRVIWTGVSCHMTVKCSPAPLRNERFAAGKRHVFIIHISSENVTSFCDHSLVSLWQQTIIK